MSTLGSTAVLFGGFDFVNGQALADTWTWDGSTWTRHDVDGPSARVYAGMASMGRSVVLFGGCNEPIECATVLGDTWTWDGATWTQQNVAGPSARGLAVMATQHGP